MNGEIFVYISFPIVAALIGWCTNYLAVKMIFRPRRPKKLLGLTIWGLLPRRQAELASCIGDTVEESLLSHEDFEQAIKSEAVRARAAVLIEEQIDRFMAEKILGNPMLAMFVQGEMAKVIKNMLVEQFTGSLYGFLDSLMREVETELDVSELISKKVAQFEIHTLEEIVFRIASKELRAIEILGGVLGFLVGLVQLILLAGLG